MLFFSGWSEKALLMRDIQTSPKRGGNVSSGGSGGKSKCKGPEVGVCLGNSKCGWHGVGAGRTAGEEPKILGLGRAV